MIAQSHPDGSSCSDSSRDPDGLSAAYEEIGINEWTEECFNVAMEPHTNFDWQALEPDQRQEFQDQVRSGIAISLRKILGWIVSEGHATPQGVMIRAYVAAWSFVPALQGLKQTQLAELMGCKHKQSVGRVVSDFRDKFALLNHRGELSPFKTPHMRSEETREKARVREKRKQRVAAHEKANYERDGDGDCDESGGLFAGAALVGI